MLVKEKDERIIRYCGICENYVCALCYQSKPSNIDSIKHVDADES